MEERYSILFYAALIALAIGIFFALVRAIRGPRIADRIMGINMIGTLTSACIAICAVMLHQSWLLDVCLVYGMISFVAVVVLAKNHIAAHREGEDEDE